MNKKKAALFGPLSDWQIVGVSNLLRLQLS